MASGASRACGSDAMAGGESTVLACGVAAPFHTQSVSRALSPGRIDEVCAMTEVLALPQ